MKEPAGPCKARVASTDHRHERATRFSTERLDQANAGHASSRASIPHKRPEPGRCQTFLSLIIVICGNMTDRKQSYIHDRALDAEYAESARRPDPAPSIKDPVKRAWCMTQWTSLSCQADQLNLPDVYFDPDTRLLDKTTNRGLWKLVVRARGMPCHAALKPGSNSAVLARDC